MSEVERLYAADLAYSQLTADINDSVTSMTVETGGNFPQTPFLVIVGNEIIKVNGYDEMTGIMSELGRGHSSSIANSHSSGDRVALAIIADYINNVYDYIDDHIIHNMEQIATTTLTEAAASITFSNIPQTYKHLKLFGRMRTDREDSSDSVHMIFNSSSVAAYYLQSISAYGTTLDSSGSGADVKFSLYRAPSSTAPANSFSANELTIYDYADTTYFKRVISQAGRHHSDSGSSSTVIAFRWGIWSNTAAITAITFSPSTGPNFAIGSSYTLYGIK